MTTVPEDGLCPYYDYQAEVVCCEDCGYYHTMESEPQDVCKYAS
ncbi:MAG: hypothetical protein ACOYJB_04075 [Christensenellaceae bacterium]|jgi:hypothetical protein